MSYLFGNLTDFDENIHAKLIKLDESSFPMPWTHQKWLDSIPHKRYFVGINDHDFSFALFDISIEDNFAHLLKICVADDARGRGTGDSLFKSCEGALRNLGVSTIFLEVDTANIPAIGLYKKNGFKLIHTKNKFYSNGNDAHIFEKQLSHN